MNNIHSYINKGIWFTIILGSILHFTYYLSGKNKLVGYFSAINESIWEHIKLSVFPIIIYCIYMFLKLRGNLHHPLFALGIGVILSVLIVPLIFYTYTKFTKRPVFPIDITIFLLAVIIPFRMIERIILLPELPFYFNIIGIIIIIFTIISFIRFTYYPPNHKMFNEGDY